MSAGPSSPRPSTFADGLRLAVGTLSVLPVRSPGVVDRRAAGVAMTAAPLVGALLGAIGAAVLAAALWAGVSPLPASVLAVGSLALLTRGLHLDGLADLADGLGSGRPADRALEIMKRSDIGPFGVVTLVLTLLLQVTALEEAASAGLGPVSLVTACAAGRLALTWACLPSVPPARPDGLGATVAGTVRRGAALAVTAPVLAGVTALAYGVAWRGPYAVPWWWFAPAVLIGLLAAWALRRRAVRRLGGVTGDVLGALVEVAATAALLVCAAVAG
ncbi:adenosylcobinamide-GDP ribazoletransferase [Streptosporangium pseudovulgare]|uniref:Adenosylcobinamide-GDP ribazoletransferase n=1 Tax=Streptosporangium pseudovulgare TaxID=35765 RepID=A0ABQ2QFT2_9ACTN|nr:adenosylcobinamide-GDP ribazoletransferase [Streptosporangium pseudovulgare]GGP78234.1 adenosylcobinamide-GDP ribazoletransferase [Streptosporangium pseudovulgare]